MPRVLLITANLGSLFDDLGRLSQRWLEYMAKTVHSQAADFVAIHLQETGGKRFEENSDKVVPLIWKLHEGLRDQFEHCYAFLDIDFTISEQFTALGSVFFVRSSIKDKVQIFDFKKRVFEPLGEAGLYVEPSINSSNRIRKEKFSRDFWPGVRWGRKGYMHSRWAVDGNILDLINLHLFHDESNLAFHENPFQYSQNRRKAMNYMLQRYDEFAKSTKTEGSANLFLFGDFNFRLNAISFLKKLTKHASEHTLETLSDSDSPKNSSDDSDTVLINGHPILDRQLSAIEYRRDDENCVLRIEKKKFEYENSKNLLSNWREYKEDDQEPRDLPLKELPVSFPPTYPWSEDPLNHNLLTNTRMPAWCDRILMNPTAFSALSNPIYTSIGMDLCMGDHKPVILAFDLP
ncbi:unnamed protein product [Bursaphelenchus xylophilus]|uniref:inositol-polyphosphate 5-phosphatase n=1 Tax=Bursaphelenchus xylophilus TaxID=6326 RepID=A0A1I7SQT2_BURXY|nr:unnamed protein product [Bursaphelenchus xylophilus]CAG9110352.1 unnamed protein product [Bursaphelenchus xylophilus]